MVVIKKYQSAMKYLFNSIFSIFFCFPQNISCSLLFNHQLLQFQFLFSSDFDLFYFFVYFSFMPILLFFYFLHCYWHYSYSIMYRGRLSQYQKSIDQTKISSATRNNQNQSDALQKQIESYTRKFQQEKRKLFRAQQNHRQVLKDYKNQVKDLESLKSSVYQTQMINLSAKIKCLQVNLQNGIASYNEALSRNNMLKAEIEELRKDKKNQKQAFKTLGQKIEELNSSISAMDQNIQTKRKKVEKTKEQILSLRQKNQKQNEEYIKYVEVLKENQSLMRDSLKNNGAKQITETSDTQPIVKLRIRNLMHQNKQKIKIAEMYKRSMEKIQQSFDQIKKESGIHDLEQITKTFLKQEEQNTLIFQYINKLTVELETIREDNQKISNKIVKHQQIMNQHKSLIGGSPEEQKQRVKVQLYCQEKQKHIDRLNNFLHAIQPCLLNALNIQNKQAAGIISHSNIQAYLAMLQQKITKKCAREESENPSAQVKQQYTKYSKPLPTFTVEEVKQKAQETIMQQPKFRDYASQFWEKKKLNK